MADLSTLTKEAVFKAIDEFDALGREHFLSHYGFGKARRYFIIHNGTRYDSKAIAGVAFRYIEGRAWQPSEFSGGDKTVARRMTDLGFDVQRDAPIE
jgi:5-methylcytosine-specific restriction protein A